MFNLTPHEKQFVYAVLDVVRDGEPVMIEAVRARAQLSPSDLRRVLNLMRATGFVRGETEDALQIDPAMINVAAFARREVPDVVDDVVQWARGQRVTAAVLVAFVAIAALASLVDSILSIAEKLR